MHNGISGAREAAVDACVLLRICTTASAVCERDAAAVTQAIDEEGMCIRSLLSIAFAYVLGFF